MPYGLVGKTVIQAIQAGLVDSNDSSQLMQFKRINAIQTTSRTSLHEPKTLEVQDTLCHLLILRLIVFYDDLR
jgi:hypothetical protein